MTAHVIVGVLAVAMLAWLPVHKRRHARWLDRQARLEAERRLDEAVAVQAPVVLAHADSIIEQATFDRNLRHVADLADRFPMPKRPAPPAPTPGEPWQLRETSTDTPGLVEPGVPENNLGGETA
jgi:hypothetical protein